MKQTAPKSLNKWRHIVDERAPKRGMTPYLAFNVNRRASGDFNGITIIEGAKLIGQEWKALSADEKKVRPPTMNPRPICGGTSS